MMLLQSNGLRSLCYWPKLSNYCPLLNLCRHIKYYNREEQNTEQPPQRITVPQKMFLKLEKKKNKLLEKKLQQRRSGPKGPLVISCARKDYNHYRGQRFDERDVHLMVSCGWKGRKRVGDHFTLVPYAQNPSYQYEEDPLSFSDLGIRDNLCTGLQELGFELPTEVQRLAIPSLLEGNNAMIAAETGSGKTLAYLLPSIDWILKSKENVERSNYGNLNCPNTIILTPNRELCDQVMGVSESLRPYADFVPYCFLGQRHSSLVDTRTSSSTPMDLLVTSPGKLKQLLKRKIIQGKNLEHIVIDESDTLLDDSFSEDLLEIFNRLKIVPAEDPGEENPIMLGTQIVLVSATMPKNVKESLWNVVTVHNMERIQTRALHQIMPHVPQKFIRTNPDGKPEKLIQILKENEEKNQPSLVFTKDNSTCFYVSKLCEEMGLQALNLRGNMPIEERDGVLDQFKEGFSDILIATDIASRGLDTVNVCHVINYDCPQFMSDYIHRVGRVGRVGTKQNARVTTFVSQKWEVDLVWKIEICARKTGQLSHVNANIKRELEALKSHKDTFELSLS